MPVTIKDIARAAGVTHPTVSRALRNHRSVSRATCDRIQELARQMSYRPDPALSALAAYRVAIKKPYQYGLMAVLSHQSEAEGLSRVVQDKVEGIRQRAVETGLELELFKVPAQTSGQRRLSRTLYHRGFRGIIVCPLPWEPAGIEFSKFTAVGIGENAMPLGINYVSYDHDHAVAETYRQLRHHGYRNIGFCNLRDSERRNRHLFSASWSKCRQLDGASTIPPLLLEDNGSSIAPWIRHHRFDAIMTHHWQAVLELREAGFRIPEELGVAGYALPATADYCPHFAGYRVNGMRMGALAVDFLQMLMRMEHIDQIVQPEVYSMVLRGQWREESSVRPMT